MTIGHFLVDQGASGDLLLGALIDAGASVADIRAAIDSLGLPDVDIEVVDDSSPGIRTTRAIVHTPDEPRLPTWASVDSTLQASSLDDGVKTAAAKVMRALFAAEATVHGASPDEVHLHEMGALDTIVDVVGVCAGLASLGLESVTHGPVNVGGGTVAIAHGRLSVPPPAVAELLTGRPVYGDGDRELTTPTGAALLATLATATTATPAMTLTATGRGTVQPSGSVVTLLVGQRLHTAAAGHAAIDQAARDGQLSDEQAGGIDPRIEPIVVIEATVDDLEPQVVPGVLDGLRALGAFDAWTSPTQMKKSRAGVTITAIASPHLLDILRQALFTDTSTIGVRWHHAERMVLARDHVTVDIDGEPVRIKRAWFGGGIVNAHPEFDDVAAAAERLDRPVRDVLHEVIARIPATPSSPTRKDAADG